MGCIGNMLMSSVDKLKQEVDQLKAQRQSLCATSDPGSMMSALGGSKGAGLNMASIGLSVICAVGVVVTMMGIGAVMPAGGGGEGTVISGHPGEIPGTELPPMA